MQEFTRRRGVIVGVAGMLAIIGAGVGIWVITSDDSARRLKASETCNEAVFSNNLKPLERILTPDSSFKSSWSRSATDDSFKIVCMNSTNRGAVNMHAEIRNGDQKDWLAESGAGDSSNVSHFETGTSAAVWGKRAAIYVKCKSHAEGSSHTAGFEHPYLSIVATASGSAGSKDQNLKQDLAQLANRMFFEAQLQTGCQEDFNPPSEPPRITG
ncbi:hypothetical protein [Streptomyces sp. NPDC020298]|uniref:hypothetical protein n=1 Tax=unclassified Streptomyces TaxID=2593676 RepID=UPI0033C287DF